MQSLLIRLVISLTTSGFSVKHIQGQSIAQNRGGLLTRLPSKKPYVPGCQFQVNLDVSILVCPDCGRYPTFNQKQLPFDNAIGRNLSELLPSHDLKPGRLLLVTKPFVNSDTEVGDLFACICGAEGYLSTNITK